MGDAEESTPMEVLARYDALVEDPDGFRAACQRSLPRCVRVNPIKSTPDRVVAAYEAADIGVRRRSTDPAVLALDTDRPGNTWPYVHGWVHGQELVSALPAPVIDPNPGDRVLAACAAPGSKATQLAGLMDDRGTLVANDKSLGRLSALRSNADRLGVTCAAVTNRDARSITLDEVGLDAVDAALVDAPCSCEGTVRKNPDVLAEWSEARLESLATVQRAILRRSIALTRPGGTVVYSTCTFAPEENEAVVDAVMGDDTCRVVPFEMSVEHAPGVTQWEGATYDSALRHAKRVYPHQNDTGGFFCVKLEVVGT